MIFTLRDRLEELYTASNRRDLIHPDPLSFVHRYTDAGDREVAGFIASCLAYGRVVQIHKSVERVIGRMGENPLEYLMTTAERDLEETFRDVVHRFTTGQEIIGTLMGIRGVIDRYGSIERCVLAGMTESRRARSGDAPIISGLCRLAGEVNRPLGGGYNSLVPCPEKGSAVKRLNLYLRWMVRKDEVDPGVWESISPAELIVPLDVHMFRISRLLGLTRRKQADMKTAREVTDGFRLIAQDDPVKYDFALASLGIRFGMDIHSLVNVLNGNRK
ncbi:MAG: TIGR02757 family protein [Deltaproteobacteria bacterium]|nr:TIGR02757 family protein [Candidatus Zymogenaceae bacterium]